MAPFPNVTSQLPGGGLIALDHFPMEEEVFVHSYYEKHLL